MSDPVTVPDWQHKLDRLFSHGAIASWDDGDPRSAVYLVPRIYVVDVEDGKPVVWMSAFAGSDKTLGPWPVTAITPLRHSPFAARVALRGHARAMRWNAGMDERLASAMFPERSAGIERFPDGGMEVFHKNEGAYVP